MSADRLRAEVPPVVTAVVGIVVALVSGVFGISAHGLAAGAAAGPPTTGQILMVAAASAGVGVVTAALARHRSPILTSAAGLVAGQGVVHLVLASGHSHGAAGPLGHHATNPAAVRAAMDGVNLDPAASASALFAPSMLGAHLAAVVLTLALVAILTGTLSWLAARVLPTPVTAHFVVVARLLASYDADAPRGRYLLARGGTRAPPVTV
ncbi:MULTISPECIES: hypothetical protein [Dietzia]|uniref:Uncharacterized protein n=1 Tax=Dietzia cinnamea TaxID=321318 RepID=A0AAW5Q9J2_9ACTN|nr:MULTISPECIES: hypothetical protein [Dietzia]AVM63684.1 hypothetical protein C3V38_04000 [Dietzia sp. oral taxon 368]MCT1638839.1 hypothetical protein [Dietzia cinnamea]MCT1864598.1 hypothetical protein [Dietzia cinnamea]MCT2030773.1 hypothetical protein [Dietzia cinnamea]MCT2034620.1 hypothetical protein [Dietzia cinnamea]